ncbi:uncharacterized protein LOC143459772 [Clavelina lepadiformis]|uniref:uncharacterized protein LOC143459772 n=1 Tax=Clavelina lepadiformis TaxID=159417 RepID=UPI00404136B5
MNIDTVGRIRPPMPGEVQLPLNVTDGKRVHGQQGGTSHSYQILYQKDATNQELFTKTVQPLLDLFIAGFNTCVLIYGESGSGKSFASAGEQGSAQPGIIPQAINYVVTNIQQQNSVNRESSFSPNETQSPRSNEERGRILMYHFEIYNEMIKDLMAARSSLSGRNVAAPMELQYSPERGMFVKNLQFEVCRNPAEATSAFWQAWLSRNVSTTDFGPANNFATYIFQLELFMMTDENPLPNRSYFTVIRLPGAEKLSEDFSRTRVREGPTLSKSIVCFNRLTADLARQQEPERVINYSDSKLTSLLENILGGNCKTRVICCLPPSNNKPEAMDSVLTGCGLLSQVKNYPIINDCLAQDLVTQYRTRLDTTLQLGGVDAGAGAGLMSRPELQDQLMKVTSDNTQLRERSDRLFQRLEQIQDKMTELAKSKSEVSTKLIASEEEKLKVSKGLVELQLENNRLTEEYESENFELKNKLLMLENQLVEFELEKNKFARSHDLSAEHTKHLEENRKQLADEFVELKKKSLAQEKDLESQVKKNEDLRTELARLIETEAALLDLRDNVERRRQAHDDATKELQRAREVLRDVNLTSSLSADDPIEKLKARRVELHREMWDKTSPRGTPRGGKDGVVARMRQAYDEQTARLEERLQELKTQLATAYAGIQAANKKSAEQTTLLISSKEDQEKLSEENSRLQQQIKEANEDYRKRLWKYVQDIANFVDNGPPADGTKRPTAKPSTYANKAMKNYTDGMMKEMKSAFRSREDQLSRAAHNYKKQSKKVASRHEKLLIHYRVLRDEVELLRALIPFKPSRSSGGDAQLYLPPIDLGPDPSEMGVTENELASENAIELNKLRAILAKTKADLSATKAELERRRQNEKSINLPPLVPSNYAQRDTLLRASDPALRKRDYHANSQMERERAELLTRATVAEQQLREQQEYIDTHLTRYKQEIVRLRKVLHDKGIRVDAEPLSPDFSPRRKIGKPGYSF